jgi:hypothetical protein
MKNKYILTSLAILAILASMYVLNGFFDLFEPENKAQNLKSFVPIHTKEIDGIRNLCLFEDSLPLLSIKPHFVDSLKTESNPIIIVNEKTAAALGIKNNNLAFVTDKEMRYPFFFILRIDAQLGAWEVLWHQKNHADNLKKKNKLPLYCLVLKDIIIEKNAFWKAEKEGLRYIQEHDLMYLLKNKIENDSSFVGF